jgi:hypothetical protein
MVVLYTGTNKDTKIRYFKSETDQVDQALKASKTCCHAVRQKATTMFTRAAFVYRPFATSVRLCCILNWGEQEKAGPSLRHKSIGYKCIPSHKPTRDLFHRD